MSITNDTMADDNTLLLNHQQLYQSLTLGSKDEIRLFDLEPSPIFESDIHGRLRIAQYSSNGSPIIEPFEALSYAWGTEINARRIIINDKTILVRGNLEAFLRRRREAENTVTLWVDAICINQKDCEEKNECLTSMLAVYASASAMTIWLGPEDEDSDIAIQAIQYLGAGPLYQSQRITNQRVVNAIDRLLSRPWWSRVWIIQEVVFGGLSKRYRLKVRCGKKQISWPTLVIAAARMKSYLYERKQYFPSISHILELDRLRENSGAILNTALSRNPDGTNPLAPCFALELVSQNRCFHATDPRDKIYALVNMIAPGVFSVVPLDYASSVENVYKYFAWWLLRKVDGLEILKHCGPTNYELPSWVPDWSVDLECLPLPSSKDRHLDNTPWWSKPGPIKQVINKANRVIVRPLKGGPDIPMEYETIEDVELPEDFEIPEMFELWSTNPRAVMAKILKRFEWAAHFDDRSIVDEPGEDSTWRLEPLVISTVLSRLKRDHHHRSFRAGGLTTDSADTLALLPQGISVLSPQGIIWDTIDEIHEGFVSNVDDNFDKATKFMVALGQCKALAEDNAAATLRYPSLNDRLRAFWVTILAGQLPESDQNDEHPTTILGVDYMTWLPPLPHSWAPQQPPLTVQTTGLVKRAEFNQTMNAAVQKAADYRDAHTTDLTEVGPVFSFLEFSGLVPATWTEEDHDKYQKRFDHLGSLWSHQRFDLYHAPFPLLNVVPDPYWHVRREQDELARRKTCLYWLMHELRRIDIGCQEESETDSFYDELISREFCRMIAFTTSMVCYGTLESGKEKYALGRKFFITKKGYFGLAPKGARSGDKIAVLLGSEVPFVLRSNGEIYDSTAWAIIGEAYVHDIMDGEVISEEAKGNVQSSTVHIM